ncbi:hypothetical protein [Alkalihalobacillus sp. 1P02AB]|uniref:hypothetical protein n=1 Tax=Alkalihalobacillus sp. 1P02AB TaxID=3132260 RepID=UPI0039A75DFA
MIPVQYRDHLFIYLPLVRKVLEKDMGKFKKVGLKFERTYLNYLEKVTNKVGIDIGKVKRNMYKKGLTIYDQGRDEKGCCKYLFVCREYRQNVTLFPHLMKNKVAEYLAQYLSGIQTL